MMRRPLLLVLVLAFALSLGINLYLFILLVDAGMALDNARTRVDILRERRELALDIISREWIGRPISELDQFADELERRGVLIGSEGDDREIGDFIFDVEGGLVIGVRDLDSPEDRSRRALP